MTLYIKTLYIVDTREEAEAFNRSRDYCSEIYSPEYAVHYGVIPHGCRYENVVFLYEGTRNSVYEQQVALFVRRDIHRGFAD